MGEMKVLLPSPVWLSLAELDQIHRALSQAQAQSGRGRRRDKALDKLSRKIERAMRRKTRGSWF